MPELRIQCLHRKPIQERCRGKLHTPKSSPEAVFPRLKKDLKSPLNVNGLDSFKSWANADFTTLVAALDGRVAGFLATVVVAVAAAMTDTISMIRIAVGCWFG